MVFQMGVSDTITHFARSMLLSSEQNLKQLSSVGKEQ